MNWFWLVVSNSLFPAFPWATVLLGDDTGAGARHDNEGDEEDDLIRECRWSLTCLFVTECPRQGIHQPGQHWRKEERERGERPAFTHRCFLWHVFALFFFFPFPKHFLFYPQRLMLCRSQLGGFRQCLFSCLDLSLHRFQTEVYLRHDH